MNPGRKPSGFSAGRASRRGPISRHLNTIARPMAWRGILAILFGLFAVSGAGDSPRALALMFGI